MRRVRTVLLLLLGLSVHADKILAQGNPASAEQSGIPRAFIGVMIRDVHPNENQAQVNFGALVSNVGAQTPASKAGLRQGDIVVGLNGQPVRSVADYRRLIFTLVPGVSIPVDLMRRGTALRLSVVVGEHPDWKRSTETPAEPPVQTAPDESSVRVLGMELQNITPEIARRIGTNAQTGAVVVGVELGSPASAARMQPDTLILSVNRVQVNRSADVANAVERARAGAGILFFVEIGGINQFLAIRKP